MLKISQACHARLPLAHFNMKHFQCKQKHVLTPSNFHEVFSTAVMPRDRLLRHSSIGGGATRVLVLDNKQHVKGVYFPLLCLPHPAVVDGGDSALGLTAANYLELITSLAMEEGPSSTLVVISHPYGVGFATFAPDGSLRMPLKNIAAPPELVEKQMRHQQQLHEEQQQSPPDEPPPAYDATQPSPLATPEYIASIARAITDCYDEYLTHCTTCFFVTRDKTASLTLRELQQEEARVVKTTSAPGCAIPFTDKRWVALPDSMLQSNRQISLYTRDPVTKERVVDQEGLSAAVNSGKLQLDVFVKPPQPAA